MASEYPNEVRAIQECADENPGIGADKLARKIKDFGGEFPSVNGICCSRSFYSVLSVIRRHRAKKTPKMSDCVGCALA